MKRTNSIGKILLIVLCVSAAISFGIAILEELVGAEIVFVTALCLIPVCYIWIKIADYLSNKGDKSTDRKYYR